MKVHEREMVVSEAAGKIVMGIHAIADEYQLTAAELVQILTFEASQIAARCVQKERHEANHV